MSNRRRELQALAAIAVEAGDAVAALYAGDVRASYERAREPVTEADLRSNEILRARLQAAFPGEPIVSEESGPESYAGSAAGPRIWFVDPLDDGTREFLKKNGEFSILIGAVEGARAEFGVVHAPALGRTWCGARGAGAYVIEASGARSEIRVASTVELAASRIVVSRSHRSEALERALEGLGAPPSIELGSAGLKGACVAEGSADAFLAVGPAGNLWDVCAIDALVGAAGGQLTDTHGLGPDYRGAELELRAGIVAANPALQRALIARLAATEPRPALA